mmetsp:Transcript_43524/g.114405  ORF Transcript_43524/g.114405 Transcript_43524/m.114405 type:complete len:119 (+) Transcript_43524:63-419(+)
MLTLLVAAAGLHLGAPSVGSKLSDKVRTACRELSVDAEGLTLPAALQACNEAMGISSGGSLIAQADLLCSELGLTMASPPPAASPPPVEPVQKPETVFSSIHAVLSTPIMVHNFSDTV